MLSKCLSTSSAKFEIHIHVICFFKKFTYNFVYNYFLAFCDFTESSMLENKRIYIIINNNKIKAESHPQQVIHDQCWLDDHEQII